MVFVARVHKGIAAVSVLIGFLLLSLQPAQAQEARCFPETGYCISGSIRSYWERNGGLPVFGYPISEARTETVEGRWTGTVQWFERDPLEDHGAEGVLAGRLGARLLEIQGRPWETLYPKEPLTPPACRHFPETGFNLCEPFLSYWRANGGLARFGYPITPTVEETIELSPTSNWTGVVQYFERRRMEYHPEHSGTPYAVQLGLLGRSVYAAERAGPSCAFPSPLLESTWAVYGRELGCPAVYAGENAPLATQLFERGEMLWVGRADAGPGQIFVLTAGTGGARWQLFSDTYVEGEPVGTAELPPPGRLAPTRGFGKLWRAVPAVRDALGWALTPEQADRGVVLQFSGSAGFSWMIHRAGTDMVFILRAGSPAGLAVDVPRVP